MSGKIKVNISIAGRNYPLTVKKEEEEVLRRAGKEVNKAVKELEEKYAVRDKQDSLSMCALQMAIKYLGITKEENLQDEELQERIQSMIQQMSNTLQ